MIADDRITMFALQRKHSFISSVDLPTLVDPDFSSVLIHFSASSFAGMLAYRIDIMCSLPSLQKFSSRASWPRRGLRTAYNLKHGETRADSSVTTGSAKEP